MANLETIRKRITSVKATQKITKAMKMVAGARLNRAQQRITALRPSPFALRPYALKTHEVLAGVATAMIARHTGWLQRQRQQGGAQRMAREEGSWR